MGSTRPHQPVAVRLPRRTVDRWKHYGEQFLLRRKWGSDQRELPLESAHWTVYRHSHRFYRSRLHRYPDLQRGEGLNDKIQWLKIFDQREESISCADKLALRTFVRERLGRDLCPRVLAVGDSWNDLPLEDLVPPYVLKTNHDSGSVVRVRDRRALVDGSLRKRFERSLASGYGWEKGEWNYAAIQPRIFAEECVEPRAHEGLREYKFHCSEGVVLWAQCIWDRETLPKESIVEASGTLLPIQLDHRLQPQPIASLPRAWERLVEVAEVLSRGFRYLRVDLYEQEGEAVVGELTFFPYSGVFEGEGEARLGVRLALDRSRVLPPLSHQVASGLAR